MDEDAPLKLILTWDITPEHEQEYFEFVIREYIPGIQRLGCELSDAWATVYGAKPQITVSMVLLNAKKVRQLFLSEEWITLTNRLQDFIQNYALKVVYARSNFQL
jgi:predicted amino acid dehydrogenase